MGHLVAAPDKFRGTASAAQVAQAAVLGAAKAGWSAEAVPMADGGEGLLEAVGGHHRQDEVTGPQVGGTVVASWRLLEADQTAVIEMAQAAGLELAGGPTQNHPMESSTTGVGELVLAAVEAGARRVVVGCGGSASTDGGWGAVAAIGDRRRLKGVDLVAAVDVTTRFEDAAMVFGPQKGATPAQVAKLTGRLERLADRYREDFGTDVVSLEGAGAAGGLAGGLAALGARIVGGFDLVAQMVGLPERLARADAVMTGEGRLDPSSLRGKVVGGVLSLTPASVPMLCVVGEVDAAIDEWGLRAARGAATSGDVRLVSLAQRAGHLRAHRQTVALVAQVVAGELPALHRGEPDRC